MLFVGNYLADIFPDTDVDLGILNFLATTIVAFCGNIIPFIAEGLYLLFESPDEFTMRVLEYWNLTFSSLLILVDLAGIVFILSSWLYWDYGIVHFGIGLS